MAVCLVLLSQRGAVEITLHVSLQTRLSNDSRMFAMNETKGRYNVGQPPDPDDLKRIAGGGWLRIPEERG